MKYVISDIHGHFDWFLKMLKKINFTDNDEMYVLGDVVDRGERGIECLQYIMKQKNMHMLLGNHEYMMLDRLVYYSYDPDCRRLWESNGGGITEHQFMQLSGEEKAEILKYLTPLPVNIEVEAGGKEYLLVHACPLPKYLPEGCEDYQIYHYSNDKEYSVWNRHLPTKYGKTVVCGHTPTFHYKEYPKARIIYFSNLDYYNIDCGAAYPEYTGRLGCMCLDTKKFFYV